MIEFAKGKYRCRIEQQGFTTSSKGTPQFELKFTVLANAAGESFTPATRYYFKPLT